MVHSSPEPAAVAADRNILLECPVFTLEAALEAQRLGVDRLELCASFAEGGETPSPGLLTEIKSNGSTPVFVMIRPRGGDFVYSTPELRVIKRDIALYRELGADGFVFGVLCSDGRVDVQACSELVRVAAGSPCTFHRAVDLTPDISQAMEDIIECGFRRILTTGGRETVAEGLPVIRQMLVQAADRILIMPGGGMAPQWVAPLRSTGNLREIHASCKKTRPSNSRYKNTNVAWTDASVFPDAVLTISPEVVAAFRKELTSHSEL